MMGVDLDYLFLGCALGVLGEGGGDREKRREKKATIDVDFRTSRDFSAAVL